MKKKMVALLVLCLLTVVVGSPISASTISELEDQKQEAEEKKKEAQEIVDQLESEQKDIQDAIDILDKQVIEYTRQMEDLKAQKAEIETKITAVEAELEVAKAAEQEQYEAMKKRIQYSYENGNIQYVDTLFSTTDISDIMNKSEYVEQIYAYDSQMLDELIRIRTDIANNQLVLESSLAALDEVEKDIEDNQAAILVLIDGKSVQLENYQASINKYQDEVDKWEGEMEAAEEALIAAREAEARRLAELAAQNGGMSPNPGASGPINSNGTSSPIYGNNQYLHVNVDTSKLNGSLLWPVSTVGYVSSFWGVRFGVMHRGIDIVCPTGTAIYAAESGTVIASFLSSTAGEYIIIDHGNGISSEYMHNSVRLVQQGDYVVRGQIISYSGNTGASHSPHLHFGVRVNGTRVDPYPYLY